MTTLPSGELYLSRIDQALNESRRIRGEARELKAREQLWELHLALRARQARRRRLRGQWQDGVDRIGRQRNIDHEYAALSRHVANVDVTALRPDRLACDGQA